MTIRQIILAAALLFLAACDSSTVPAGALSVRYEVEGSAAIISFTDASGISQATATGNWDFEFNAQPGDALVLEATSTSASPVTGSIYINGQLANSQRGLHVRLENSSSTHQSGEIELRGFIEARSSGQVTVLGRRFVIDGQTQLLGRNNESISFDAFQLGVYIEAEGRAQSDGTIQAKKLKLEDGDEQNRVEIDGLIEARTESSVTVQGLVFVVDGSTRLLDDDNNPISFGAFQVGLLVEAEGFARNDGTYYAEKLKLDDD